MRLLSLTAMIIITFASNADAACRRAEERTPYAWASSLARSAAVIMEAETILQQDTTIGQEALLRPLSLYKGVPAKTYAMSLPRSDARIVTEAYAGFPGRPGEHRFLILYRSGSSFETRPCDQVLVENPAIKAAIIRKTGS